MRNGFLKALLGFALLATATLCNAEFPDKPIRLVVPYPAGGTTDTMARILQEQMAKTLGQPVIVENKSGASGAIATKDVARSAPDGYSLIFGNNGPSAITPLMQKDAGYDPVKDFAPVSMVAVAPMSLVVHSGFSVQDVKGLIEFARKNPNKVEYSTAGVGSFGHLATELFAKNAGIKLFHVPYKGSAPSTLAVTTGEVKMLLTTSSAPMTAGIQAGKLKLLGVTSLQPSPLAPGAPTISEALPNFEINVWFGILAPAGTPSEVVAKLNDAIAKALAQTTVQQRFVNFGVSAKASTPKELGDMVATEVETWRQVIRESNIQSN